MTPWLALVVALAVLGVLALVLIRRSRSISDGDARVLEQLRRAGSKLGKPHDIEFFFYFPTEASAQRIVAKLASMAFGAEVRPAAEGSSQPWHVLAVRRMVPELAEIQRLRADFTALAQDENGEFDGWGTPIVQ